MNVKLHIREVKEEIKELTIEERRMLSNSESGRGDLLTAMARDRLRKLGFVGSYVSNRDVGVFRTETIRDATPKEMIAWHCLQLYKECDNVDDTCYACPLNVTGGICIPRKCEERSKKVLEGKEVILSLTEE